MVTYPAHLTRGTSGIAGPFWHHFGTGPVWSFNFPQEFQIETEVDFPG